MNDVFFHVLVALIVVILAARACGALFRYLGQPPVVGEVVAGIALGPSLLGRVSPAAAHYVLPATVAPYLSVLAQVGVVLFMFLVGLELDTERLRERARTTVAVSHASIALPFALGVGLAFWLYPRLSSPDVPFLPFTLFFGVSLSVTAFPVLARILTDRKIQKTRLGVLALACAAVDDVTAWCLLAFVVSITSSNGLSAVRTLGLSLAFVLVMVLGVRRIALRFVRRQELRQELPQGAIAVVIIGLLVSALTTEAIGIHAIFGAFLLGAILPHDSRLARELVRRLEDVVVVLFLPAFFAFTGMRTEIALLGGAGNWLICGVIIAVASFGKFGGSYAAGRLTGLAPSDAASLGVLMNTRGLMELVVLNVGLDLGVISKTLFAMLVLMAVVTTMATTPLLALFYRGDGADARLARDGVRP
jgi:Kef-type K+ transport system membrane component KefB